MMLYELDEIETGVLLGTQVCPECRGKGSVEREVRVPNMNSGGFAFIDVECSRCEGEGEIRVETD